MYYIIQTKTCFMCHILSYIRAILKLAIERLRGTVDREFRFCKYCVNNGQNVIEDEYHLLTVCPLYNVVRNVYLSNHLHQNNVSFNNVMSSQN